MIYFVTLKNSVFTSISAIVLISLIIESVLIGYVIKDITELIRYHLNIMFEVSILITLLWMVSYMGYVSLGIGDGFPPLFKDSYIRNIIVIILLLATILRTLVEKKNRNLIYLFIPLILVYRTEKLLQEFYPIAFTTISIFIIIRGLIKIYEYNKLYNIQVSTNSVLEGIDKMPGGLMIYEEDGYIQLMNEKMSDLVYLMCGKLIRNGKYFYEEILLGEKFTEKIKKLVPYETIYKFSDNTVWYFEKDEIVIGNKKNVHLSAVNITEKWKLTEELNEQEEVLTLRKEQLSKTINEIIKICKEEELLNTKSQFHNIMGQKTAIMLRSLREDMKIPKEMASEFEKDIIEMIFRKEESETIEKKLKRLKNMLSGIGVELIINGNYYKNTILNNLLSEIILETTSNAVRHGMATKITVDFIEEEKYKIVIRNNGIIPKENIKLTGGLSTMKKRVETLGGSLKLETTDEFIILIEI